MKAPAASDVLLATAVTVLLVTITLTPSAGVIVARLADSGSPPGATAA